MAIDLCQLLINAGAHRLHDLKLLIVPCMQSEPIKNFAQILFALILFEEFLSSYCNTSAYLYQSHNVNLYQ
jgi:hypothetical protein